MMRFEPAAGTGGSGMLPGTESRIRIRAQQLLRVADDAPRADFGALEALEADLALAPDAPEDVLALARRAAEVRTTSGS